MIRLHVVVEGQTEETFVRELVGPGLATHNIFADARRVETGRSGVHIYRGGGRRYGKWKKDLSIWMKQDDHPEVWFTTMVDLYGLPTDFPGHDDCARIAEPCPRVECLENHFQRDIGHPRFIPYIQLHEFEALLFADTARFAAAYPSAKREIADLTKIRTPFKTVDEINDGRETSPSKRIEAIFPSYDKVLAGAVIAIDIGIAKMRQESPHFDQWLARLYRLATSTA